ncbi:MAG TPA: asparagine synthase (glutamine-hydrolyzing) [Vicinamibacterales bacterium]|nr:asparagine synthase (glutamine-hydrolyzing) [Vicinamibacterales bacterium]
MCGICGVVSVDGDLPPQVSSAVTAMTDRLYHRGPDGAGYYYAPWVALGHRRLAIIDRAGGEQPMANEDRSAWIVFNGEIYNHHDLRRELESRGHRFRTKSDTEAIVHAYEQWGDACVEHLDGMFAFAIADLTRRRVLLARDRLGKKPLFHAMFDGVLHFASEIKALKASPLWNGDVNLDSVEGYLSLGYFVAPATVYRHVSKLEPAHTLSIDRARVIDRKYWDITSFDTDERSARSLIDEVDARLAAAVSRRLESEVPIGAFLSGGIDSGLVVSYMAQALGRAPLTASVGFDQQAHNELEPAGLTAAHFATRHTTATVDPRLEEVLDPIVKGFDEPFADPSAIPTFYVSQMARQHVTVALSGDGGDEAFGGYVWRYRPHELESKVRRFVPGAPGRKAAAWLGARWPRVRAFPRPLRLGNVLENLGRDPAGAYYADLCFLKPQDARALLGKAPTRDPGDSPVYEQVTRPYRDCRSESAVQRAQYADLKVYLPNDPLVKVDRMSMANSLEIRCPLLDHRIVELAFRIPTRTKMPNGQPKSLLRGLAERRLPRAVVNMPKRGFTAPVGSWLAGPYAEPFRADVLAADARSRDVVDRDRLATLFREHRTGAADHSFALWAVWMLERWARQDLRPALA